MTTTAPQRTTPIELVYRSAWAEVWRADARDVLPNRDTESVDLVVTDPPYGAEWRSNLRAERFELIANDTPQDRAGIHEVLVEAVRLVGQHRHLYVFGPTDVVDGLKVSASTELIWDKGRHGAGDLAAPWGPQHERITFAVSLHRHGGKTGEDMLPVRLRKGSVLRFSPPTGRKVRHPSEKPVPLLRELIESSTRAGEVVLDPFAGVGSTGVAAVLSGRRAVLIDLDEDDRYLPIAVSRIRAAEAIVQRAEEL